LCRNGVRGFDAAYSYGAYEGVLRELINIYKYGRVETLARPLADLLRAALPRDEKWDAVTSVPLHWRRKWQRGFNQSELLARDVARGSGAPLVRALRRVRATPAQAGLSRTARRRNMTAAFRVRRSVSARSVSARSVSIDGRRILLIDDVLTTGSTAAACARVLKQAGAARVIVLTVARADRRRGSGQWASDSMQGEL
jgi:ComF family protein